MPRPPSTPPPEEPPEEEPPEEEPPERAAKKDESFFELKVLDLEMLLKGLL